MKTKFGMLSMIACFLSISVAFTGCNNGDDDDKGIVGKWYLHQYIDVETENGVTETETWTYNPTVDFNYHAAELLEFTNEKLFVYENESGTEYDTYTTSYSISGNMLIITDNDDGEIEIDTILFTLEGDVFSLIFKEEYGGYSYSSTTKYKRYDGNIPPSSWITAIQNDDYEPDNSYREAKEIALGSNQSHVITSGDFDWFKFNAVSGETYLIEVSGYMDGYSRLYDTSGSNMIDSDDDNDYDINIETSYWGNPVILWTCSESGVYYFNVSGYDDDDEGYYGVVVNTSTLTPSADKTHKEKRKRTPLFGKR